VSEFFFLVAFLSGSAVVTAVAERGFLRGFTATEKNLLGLLSDIFHWAEFTALVGTVAKGLFLAFATAAPKVTFTCLNLHDKGGVGGSYWLTIGHILVPVGAVGVMA